jgi:hypothetical protein
MLMGYSMSGKRISKRRLKRIAKGAALAPLLAISPTARLIMAAKRLKKRRAKRKAAKSTAAMANVSPRLSYDDKENVQTVFEDTSNQQEQSSFPEDEDEDENQDEGQDENEDE